MKIDQQYLEELKEKARRLYESHRTIYNPYLDCEVALSTEGFRHLQFSGQRERSKREQLLRFRLLPLALEMIRRSSTLQEYRRRLEPVGKPSARGETALKWVEYWGFVAIMGRQEAAMKLRSVLRRVGEGIVTFWSVMPFKLRKGGQRLFEEGIEDG